MLGAWYEIDDNVFLHFDSWTWNSLIYCISPSALPLPRVILALWLD